MPRRSAGMASADGTRTSAWRARRHSAMEAARLRQQIDRLTEAGRYRDAVAPAKQLAELRSRLQGAGHWQAIDAGWEVRQLSSRAKWSAQQQAEDARLHQWTAQGTRLIVEGHYRDAEALLRKALTSVRQTLGEDHPETATGCNNLAICLDHLGRYADARAVVLDDGQALRIRRKALGEYHPDTAGTCNDLAYCLGGAAGTEIDFSALSLFRKALRIRLAALGEEHRLTLMTYNNVAVCLDNRGLYTRAQPLLERVLAIKRRLLGEDDISTATGYTNLAYCLNAQGHHALALPLYEKAAPVPGALERAQGEGHPETAMSYSNLAQCV